MWAIAMRVMRPVGFRACPFTTLVWKVGASKDPGGSAPVRQVKLWTQIWEKAEERDDIGDYVAKAWNGFLSDVMIVPRKDGAWQSDKLG